MPGCLITRAVLVHKTELQTSALEHNCNKTHQINQKPERNTRVPTRLLRDPNFSLVGKAVRMSCSSFRVCN